MTDRFAGRPVDEWTEALATDDARKKAKARGVEATPEQLADLLTDLGFVPQRNMLVQSYRSMGLRYEAEFWGIFGGAKQGEKTTKQVNSIATLAEITGYSQRQLARRRKQLTNMIAAQVEVWGEP